MAAEGGGPQRRDGVADKESRLHAVSTNARIVEGICQGEKALLVWSTWPGRENSRCEMVAR